MINRSSRFAILKRSFPATPGRRFLCFLLDLIILIVLSITIFLPTFNFVMATEAYTKYDNVINEEVAYYKEYTKNSHVLEYNDNNERYGNDKIIYMYLARAICQSYEVFGTEGEPDFVLNDQVQKYGVLNSDNNNLCYFYTTYLSTDEHKNYVDMHGKDNVSFYYDEFYNAFAKPSEYFDMGEEKKATYGMPILKNSVANKLMKDSYTSSGSMTASLYQEIAEGLEIMFTRAEDFLLNAEPYHSTHYLVYCEAMIKCVNVMNTYLVFTILLSALIVVALPKAIFGNEMTFARRLFGIGAVNEDGEMVKWWVVSIRTTIEVLASIPVMIFMYLLPPFNMELSTLAMPVALGSSFNFALFAIVILVCYALAKVPILFSHGKQSSMDLLTRTYIVDTHFQNDDFDEEIEAKPL